MTGRTLYRALASFCAPWRAKGSGAGTTTGRWQDKRPQIAGRTVGCFYWVFQRVSHIAMSQRNVPELLTCPELLGFSHIAGQGHGR
jgi:hypothetical protein